ncbi:ribosomal protein S18-alanine N-acetyltransferase [Shewanella atlantica]|uniref:ribosomal protein S18-alanine N-acetyltransferase n=1 Tax=Shewanella atlantica TaxID=271099 RepID=UPI00373566F1
MSIQPKVEVCTLDIDASSQMAHIASLAHSHPMSLATIKTCFGKLYTSLGVYQEGELQGFAILHQIFEDATLMDICINPKFQGRGLGSMLLEQVIALASKGEAETLLLEVRDSGSAAKNLYLRHGFQISGHRKDYYKTDDGTEDAVLMELKLSR